MPAILKITDGTTEIDLLTPNGNSGWCLDRWNQSVLSYKDEGVWRNSPLADGRRLAFLRRNNVVDTFRLNASSTSQDSIIREDLQELERLLEKAVEYWTSEPQDEPVYIVSRASCETETRYALVFFWEMPEINSPYAQPFLQPKGAAVLNEVNLIIEHAPWQNEIPGEDTCTQLSAQQTYTQTEVSITASPTANSDDAIGVEDDPLSFSTGTQFLRLGNFSGDSYSNGVRFTSVAIPNGATITEAYITFDANQSDSNKTCKVLIYGEDVDDAVTFSTAEDFFTRIGTSLTGESVAWGEGSDGIPAWTASTAYDTPSIIPIIQEIVNRSGWATGNDIVIFFLDNESDSGAQRRPTTFDDPTEPEAVLNVTYRTADINYGRSATCLNEVYFANRHNRAQITDAYANDVSGGTFAANIIGAAKPVDLFPDPIQNGDILYIGINTALVDSGPFGSLVFDIGTAAAYTGGATADWEYYNGGWVGLRVRDNTDQAGYTNGEPFSRTGVNSVHWEQPDDWTAVAINGVTAYWVRVVVSLGAGAMTVPTQQNRDIYSIVWPYVSIDDGQVGGDITAIFRARIQNQSDWMSSNQADPSLYANRMIMGLRSDSRGADFSAYINLQQEQNPPGIAVGGASANITFTDDTTTATGRRTTWSPAAQTAMGDRLHVTFDSDIANQYYGRFHAFLRAEQVGGDTTTNYISCRLQVQAALGYAVWTSEEKRFEFVDPWQVLDFGEIVLPPVGNLLQSETLTPTGTRIAIQAESGSATPDVYFYELILIPVDEWSLDAIDFSGNVVRGTMLGDPIDGEGQRYLSVDSTLNPRSRIRTLIQRVSDDRVVLSWVPVTSAPATLQANRDQKLWFFNTSFVGFDETAERRSEPEVAHSIQMWDVQRYITMRGDR